MNTKEQALRSEPQELHRFHGKVGIGHIPTVLVAVLLWWLIFSALPIGQ